MTRLHANLLRAFSAWTVFVWGTRLRNVWTNSENSMGFKLVHTAVAAVSVAFAIVCWWVVTQNRGRNVAQRAAEAERGQVADAAKRAAKDLESSKEQRH
jgi:hypothetical protein